jgi:NTE family protein
MKKVAIACQGGGIHASFTVGVLSEILDYVEDKKLDSVEDKKFELVGLSGTSAGALCALMVWYGLASKKGSAGSARDAREGLNKFWKSFAAESVAERILNFAAVSASKLREVETSALRLQAPVFSLNPSGAITQAVFAVLPQLGIRQEYFDLKKLLHVSCPDFESIDWSGLKTRLLVGATDVLNGIEAVFDSDLRKRNITKPVRDNWRMQVPLSLAGVAASGTLPEILPAERIDGTCYWDGLYSLNPPIREFWKKNAKEFVDYVDMPDEIWVVRINPQQCRSEPQSHAAIEDRENELMGNLSLNKELDFIAHMNELIGALREPDKYYKRIILRTIKMTRETAAKMDYASKFNRSSSFMDQLRLEGHETARQWLRAWENGKAPCYPDDAGYEPRE